MSANNFTNDGFAISVQGTMQILNNRFVDNNPAVLCYTGSNTLTGNTFIGNTQGVILQSTGNVLKNNVFVNNTDSLPINQANFQNDIDSSNTLNGKPMYYWVNQQNKTVPSDAGFVALVNCSGIVVQNLVLANQTQGVLLAFTSNCTLTGNVLANNTYGVFLYGSPFNQFVGNNLTDNGYAVYISGATGNPFMGGYSEYTPSSGNLFYLNNFIDNNQTVYDLAGAVSLNATPSMNFWDNGKEGNYWSNYTGVDANGDGIGDSFYVVYANNNTDHYPLMNPYTQNITAAPELSAWIILPLLALITTVLALYVKGRRFQTANRGSTK